MSIFNFRKRPAGYGGEEKAETYDFFEIATLFRFTFYFQSIRGAFVLAGNELATVLLACACTVSHSAE